MYKGILSPENIKDIHVMYTSIKTGSASGYISSENCVVTGSGLSEEL